MNAPVMVELNGETDPLEVRLEYLIVMQVELIMVMQVAPIITCVI